MFYRSYVVITLSLMLTAMNCQTFQYSRGWTNGKRVDAAVLGIALPLNLRLNYPSVRGVRRVTDPVNIHCGLPKLNVLHQRNVNSQVIIIIKLIFQKT